MNIKKTSIIISTVIVVLMVAGFMLYDSLSTKNIHFTSTYPDTKISITSRNNQTTTADSNKGVLSVHSIASQMGENTSEAKAKVTADGQITLNSRYLSEALSVIDGENVEFSFSGKIAPCILKSTDPKTDYYHIIMPLKS